MKFLKWMVTLLIFSDAQAAQHPAEKLARAYIALIGERFGKESSMSSDFKVALDALYSERYAVISNDEIIVSSRNDLKKKLANAKRDGGLWKVTDVVYVPDNNDKKNCKIIFRWWTQKKGVFDIKADMQISDDGTCIEFVEEITEQVFTSSEVS